MPSLTSLLPLLAFFAIAALLSLIAWVVARLRRDPMRRRLESIDHGETAAAPPPGLAETRPTVMIGTSEVQRDLRRAGFYRYTAMRDFGAVRNGLALLVVIVTGVFVVVVGPERTSLVHRLLLGGALAAAVAWSAPRVVLGFLGRRRVRRICEALPDALDMIGMCLLGGLTLEDALAHVSREISLVHPDLGVELAIIRKQADLNSMEFAFEQFADRIDGPEVVSLQSLIAQDRRLGSGVGRSIREFADALRVKRRQTADEKSNAVLFQLLFPVTLCLLPASVLLLWTPACVTLFEFLRDLSTNTVTPAP